VTAVRSRFVGKRVVVTGAGSGVGRVLTELLLVEGAQVAGIDLSTGGIPEGAHPIIADLASPSQVEAAAQESSAVLGGVDILCNNAGAPSTTSVIDCSLQDWEQTFAVNARAPFLMIRALLPGMLERGSGVIVNTASVAGMIGLPDRAAYCSSKGALMSLSKQVAIQYATSGIRCLCVCPGVVDSPWVVRLLEAADDPEAARASLIARQPMGRLATPEEVALAIAFAASDEAAFMTGNEIVLDGGILAG